MQIASGVRDMKTKRLLRYLSLGILGVLLAVVLISLFSALENRPPAPAHATVLPDGPSLAPADTDRVSMPVADGRILLDDFGPQPYQGQSVYFYNRLGGDRGALNDSSLGWGDGRVSAMISSGNAWGGVWMSLNHPIREGLAVDFSAILPPQIVPAFQTQITGLVVRVVHATPGRTLKLELKDGSSLRWKEEISLSGGSEVLSCDLPPLGSVNHFVVVLDHASPGDSIVLESVSLEETTAITDTATAAFVWTYGMLLSNWNPTTGLVRDKAKDASGEFDAIQATGSLAAATAVAEQLGVVTHSSAVQIVDKISDTLLLDLPRYHGLWPHWVTVSGDGETAIVPDTEWSSVDTAIAAVGLLAAQDALGMDTAGTEQLLQAIDWDDLVTPYGISHGYRYTGDLIPYAWDTFGGESWLVEMVYAGATGRIAPMTYPSPPTANGSGFIDELAWLFVPPPPGPDYWGTDWTSYRLEAADDQIAYFPTHHPDSCLSQLGLYGLSAAEVPAPWAVPQHGIYQAFGAGGLAEANDGVALLGAPVAVPHYAAMTASLRPEEAVAMWDWLIDHGHFSPLTNVESLLFPAGSDCSDAALVWNQLKGSWNLSLQALGWGRYLAERDGQVPVLWQATTANSLLGRGYTHLARGGSAAAPAPASPATPTTWMYERECEYPDEASVGQMIWRSSASGSKAHGQFGATAESPWPARSGHVTYREISIPEIDGLYLELRYSKHSPSSVPILIFVDNEPTSRATLYPADQGDWDRFVWTEPILLGDVASGIHSLRFSTDGQQYGTADLDAFILTAEPAPN
jgi:hypothetical protein